MIIAISGSSGFIGSTLVKALEAENYQIIQLVRKDFLLGQHHIAKKIENADIIINLAGATIQKRWTRRVRKEILESRVNTTRILVNSINRQRTKLFISASAIGIYDDTQTQTEENCSYDKGQFLYTVCNAWENEALQDASHYRVVILRLGVVLGEQGAIGKMLPVFRLGFGGKLGNGDQIMSWIHIKDVVSVINFIINNSESNGIYNASSPDPCSNKEFTRTLAKILKRPCFFTIPAFFLKIIYGKSSIILLKGAEVIPARLSQAGYKFNFCKIDDALNDVVSKISSAHG